MPLFSIQVCGASGVYLEVFVDKVHDMGDEGVTCGLGRLTHHAKVQVAQVSVAAGQQVACTCTSSLGHSWASDEHHMAGACNTLRFQMQIEY